MEALKVAFQNEAGFIASPNSCVQVLSEPDQSARIVRVCVDATRIQYDDPGGRNTNLLKAVGRSLEFDIFEPWDSNVPDLNGCVEFNSIGKRYGNVGKKIHHGICLYGNLLLDVGFTDRDAIENLVVSHVARDWGQISRHLPLDQSTNTDATSILRSGGFVSNSWLKGYLDKKNYEVVKKHGLEFWPDNYGGNL